MATSSKNLTKQRRMYLWLALGAGAAVIALLFTFLSSLASTTRYYVLNQDVPANTQIQPSMLSEQVVSVGGQPRNALTVQDVASRPLFAKIDLNRGDIVTTSNAGEKYALHAGLPEDFVVASFISDPNFTAGGNVSRGDYIDIYLIEGDRAILIFQRVLVIDTTRDLNSRVSGSSGSANAPAADADAYRVGIPSLYTVGLSQEDAGLLALASKYDLYVVLSSRTAQEGEVEDNEWHSSLEELLARIASDAGKGTDKTFSSEPPANGTDPNKPTVPETPIDPDNPNSGGNGQPSETEE